MPRREPKTRAVRWTSIAKKDLQKILDYLLDENPSAAGRALDRIEAKAAQLSTFSKRGRVVPELAAFRVKAYREIQIPPYRLIYRLSDKSVLIFGVLDSRRNLEDILLDRLLDP